MQQNEMKPAWRQRRRPERQLAPVYIARTRQGVGAEAYKEEREEGGERLGDEGREESSCSGA